MPYFDFKQHICTYNLLLYINFLLLFFFVIIFNDDDKEDFQYLLDGCTHLYTKCLSSSIITDTLILYNLIHVEWSGYLFVVVVVVYFPNIFIIMFHQFLSDLMMKRGKKKISINPVFFLNNPKMDSKTRSISFRYIMRNFLFFFSIHILK